jgi:hypothetical protein
MTSDEELQKEIEQQEAYSNSIEGIRDTIRVSKDSVWVIQNEIEKKSSSEDGKLTREGRKNIERNVEHLEIILSRQNIIESGEDLSELQAGVVAGKAALAE